MDDGMFFFEQRVLLDWNQSVLLDEKHLVDKTIKFSLALF